MSTDYINYSGVVLLASIEVPREITDPDDLHDLHLLASQDLVSFGSTMQRGENPDDIFTIPTAKLTEYGQVVLDYMRSKMDDSSREQLLRDVTTKSESMNRELAAL